MYKDSFNWERLSALNKEFYKKFKKVFWNFPLLKIILFLYSYFSVLLLDNSDYCQSKDFYFDCEYVLKKAVK